VREVDVQHLDVAKQPEAGNVEEKEGHSMVEGTCCSSLDSNNMRYNQEIAKAAEAVGCYGRMSV
jgi:hypothetical protein